MVILLLILIASSNKNGGPNHNYVTYYTIIVNTKHFFLNEENKYIRTVREENGKLKVKVDDCRYTTYIYSHERTNVTNENPSFDHTSR